jgi:hypothetical protein
VGIGLQSRIGKTSVVADDERGRGSAPFALRWARFVYVSRRNDLRFRKAGTAKRHPASHSDSFTVPGWLARFTTAVPPAPALRSLLILTAHCRWCEYDAGSVRA